MIDSVQKLAETATTDIRGTSNTVYALQPVTWIQEIVDGAKTMAYFASAVKEVTVPAGSHQVILPKRKQYLGYHGMTWNTMGSDDGGSGAGTGPYANTIADISWTTINNADGVTAKPIPVLLGAAVRKYDLDTNAAITVQYLKDELMYALVDRLEVGIATALGDATDSTSTAAGAQTLFGGDATSSATLAAGDTLTTDLIATATRYLSDLQFGYRASTYYGAETRVAISSYRKNPWSNTPDDPFVLFAGPCQEEALRKDSQFMNASEYGGREVILTGEIGKLTYLGVKIVVSNSLERTAASGTAPDTQTAAVATTRCLLIKPKRACALVWGKRPELRSWEYNERDEVRVGLYCYYDIKTVQDDAVIKIDVADV